MCPTQCCEPVQGASEGDEELETGKGTDGAAEARILEARDVEEELG